MRTARATTRVAGMERERGGQVKEERRNQGGEEERRGGMGCERPWTEIKGGKGGG